MRRIPSLSKDTLAARIEKKLFRRDYGAERNKRVLHPDLEYKEDSDRGIDKDTPVIEDKAWYCTEVCEIQNSKEQINHDLSDEYISDWVFDRVYGLKVSRGIFRGFYKERLPNQIFNLRK